MKVVSFITISCLLLTCSLFAERKAADFSEGPIIKVLLAKDTNSVLLEARGAYRVVRKDTGSFLGFGLSGKRFVCHALEEGLRWGEEYPAVYQITVLPQGTEATMSVDGIQYKGAISIYQSKEGLISVVNEVPIEDYLKSTLSLFYKTPLPKEAMAALVIAARTDAYAKISQNRPWDIEVKKAGYYGVGVTQRKNQVDEAIDWTRHMVVRSSKSGELVPGVQIPPGAAEELAERGADARKIFSSLVPDAKLTLPSEVRFR